MSTRKNENNVSIGNSGEYFVAAELSRRGFDVAVPMSNVPMFDLLARRKKDGKLIAIQVKTTGVKGYEFIISEGKNHKITQFTDKNNYWVFVKAPHDEEPIYYIYESKEVTDFYTNWRKTPTSKGKNKGRFKNDSDNYTFETKNHDPENHKNNWKILLG